MLTEDALTFARVARELDIISERELLEAVARWGAEGARLPLRTLLVRSGTISEEEAQTIARASVFRPSESGLRGTGYELGELLGKGANGVVHEATDTSLRRQVALKMHSKGAEMSNVELLRFTHEAQVTGQLGHPGVIPVHDLGTLPDGRPYYTMRKIGGSSLKQVFASLKAREPETLQRWTPTHMVVVLMRVAEALGFAHDRGVIHRDVKPANIMAGDYGEVLLLDWGVARVLGETPGGGPAVDTWRSEGGEDLTIDGTVAGTPAYMAPEQARGDIEAIGPAADVYSIGVILYEFFCGKRPFRARNIQSLLDMVVSDTIVPLGRRDLRFPLPVELEALIMRCLAKKPAERFKNGSDLAKGLEGFLAGSRNLEQADRLHQQGAARLLDYQQASNWAREEEQRLRQLEAELPPWAVGDEREAVWAQAACWAEQRSRRDNLYDEASSLLLSALEYCPQHSQARTTLGQLFLRRLNEVEERGEKKAAGFFRKQVAEYAPELLQQRNQEFSLQTEPAQVQVSLFRLIEQDRLLLPKAVHAEPLRPPISKLQLEDGSYTLRLEADGYFPVTAAFAKGRHSLEQDLSLRLKLPRLSDIAPGFTVIPEGPFRRGGDPIAIDSLSPAKVDLKTYAIARHPVTCGEFRQWLNSGDAPSGAPQSFQWWNELSEIPRHERDRLPALGVPLVLAESYARWLTQQSGFQLRLPGNDEWEKAARGVDGRIFPWGNNWVATYCSGPEGFADSPRPRPIGFSEQDQSVYGVFDLAGGVSEWVTGSVPHRPEQAWLRGGSWRSHPRHARICSRSSLPRTSRDRTVGFRLLQELS